MNRKKIVLALSLVVIAVLLIKGKSLLDERREQIKKQPIPSSATLWISVVKGQKGVLKQKQSALAEILSDKSIVLSTKLPGYVENVMVEEATKVKKGDLLVRIDSYELHSNIEALQKTLIAQKSDFILAKEIYERNKKLVAIGGISKENFTASKVAMEMKASTLEGTKQKLSQLQHQLTYLEIRAPFDGVIERIFLRKGDLAVTGKPILSMNNEKQKLLFSYAPSVERSIKKGEEVLYNKRTIGHVKSIYPAAKNGLQVAEVSLNEPLPLPVGSSVNVDVVTKEAKGCILPDTTVVHKKDGTYVMVYKEGKFIPQKVEIMLWVKNRILIKSCPALPVASASETKLSALPAYGKVSVIGAKDE